MLTRSSTKLSPDRAFGFFMKNLLGVNGLFSAFFDDREDTRYEKNKKEEKNGDNTFSYFIEKNCRHSTNESERINRATNEIMGKSKIHQSKMEMMNHISLEWIFFVIESH